MQRVTILQYWMDPYLIANLETLLHNIKNDWDFMLLITGDGMVRVGKSEIAQQIGYYVAWRLGTPFSVDNICFSGEELRAQAHKLPKNSVLIYDEARGELDNKKLMEKITRNLLDFFAECGMYNHLIIIVLPDYFELPKGIAINRSDALINVVRSRKEKQLENGITVMEYQRGHFQFFDRKAKKKLYIEGKKQYDNYDAAQPNFWGEFRAATVIDKEAYLRKKLSFLQRSRTGQTDTESRFAAVLRALCTQVSQREASRLLEEQGVKLSQGRINQLIRANREQSPRESP